MKFSYQEFSRRIWEFNESKAVGKSTLSVYFYLLKMGSEIGYSKFTVSDSQISRTLNMTRKTIKICKDKLRRFGIITYQGRNGVPTDFQLIADYPLIYKDTTDNSIISETKIYKEIGKISGKSKVIETETIEFENKVTQLRNIKLKAKDTPTLEEFLEYAESIHTYDVKLKSELETKYENWVNNGWKNNLDRPITNWRSALKNSLPYLSNNAIKNKKSIETIPTIRRIKIDGDS